MNQKLKSVVCSLIALSLIAVVLPGNSAGGTASAASPPPSSFSIVGMRRLTETQYRNSIADIFGPNISVSGRFEPIVRPAHELIASGARDASISPAGFEQFDALARGIATQVFDEQHRGHFVSCSPADSAKSDAACASAVLTPIGRYLFRRPLTSNEQAFYVKLAGSAVTNGASFYDGLELALATMLISPNFLYVIETAEPDPDRSGQLRLANYSRATRLAMLLWDSAPNENLQKAAAEGRLTDQGQLESVATSMVNSPRFEQGIRAFFGDMLLFEKFGELSKDQLIYPYFSPDVGQAMPEQMLRTIVDHLVTREGDYRQLFTTNRTFMNRALGSVYQVPVSKSSGWEPYTFSPSDDRAGLLGQAGFLALYSHSGRSSSTLRGRAIRELLMCQPVPNPPGNVDFTAVQDTASTAMPTARIRLEAHINNPVCAGCHKITDPLGLTLERFDGIGAFRAKENGAEIDISGAMGRTTFSGAMGLGQAMAKDPQTTQCVASRAIQYAMGRPTVADELVETTEQGFAAAGYTIRSLFLKVATAPAAYQVIPAAIDNHSTQISLTTLRRRNP
jgi:hypothetical protein